MDQETGETVTDGAGKEITAAVDFTGKAGSQTVTVNYSFDASTMAGGKYVVFESVYLMDGEEKILMATHEDLAEVTRPLPCQRSRPTFMTRPP